MGYDSLVLAEQIELLGGGVKSTLPACANAVFRLAPGFDLSAPQPTASQVASLVLDGERPIGRRASNRKPALPIAIMAPDRATLAAAREVLVRAIDADTFTLRWTRDGSSLPLILDCYRADATVVDYSILRDKALVSNVAISFQAAPYGRSDTPLIVDFPAPLAGRTAPGSPVLIDDYSTVTGAHWSQSTQGPGAFSAFWTSGSSGIGVTSVYTRAGLGPLNLSGMQAVTVMAGFGSTGFFPWWALRQGAKPVVTFTLTLTDGTHSASAHITRQVRASNNSVVPVWQRIRILLPTGAVNLAAVTGYTLTISNNLASDLRYTELYLSTLQAVPWASSQSAAPVTGTMIDLAGIAGSARAAVSLQCSQPAGTSATTTKIYSTPGTFYWLAPVGTTRVQRAECYGAGAKGADTLISGGNAAGGPGAEYAAEPGVPVVAGTAYPVVVAAASTTPGAASGPSTFTGGDSRVIAAHSGTNRNSGATTALAGGTGYTVKQQLSGDSSTFEGSLANWVGSTNCNTLVHDNAQAHGGSFSAKMLSLAAGDMFAQSCGSNVIQSQGLPCDSLYPVTANGWVRSSIVRACALTLNFYDVNGNALTFVTGSTVNSITTGWTALPQFTATPPAGAVFYRVGVKITATAAANEAHWIDDITSVSGVAYQGGSGSATTGPGGGGGGGGAGPTGPGGAGSGVAGGASGGGLAGAGGTAHGPTDFPGVPGSQAGGGGSGGTSATGTLVEKGGSGGNGAVALTYTQSASFRTLIAHRPGFNAPDTLCPFVPVPVTDTPNGATEYAVPTLIQGQPARFGSTYSVIAVSNAWNNPSASRQVTVQVKHYEQLGGNVYTQSVSRTLTPNSLPSPFAVLGELTLPDHAIPEENTNAFFTITVQSSNTSDRFQDVLFVDTQGSMVMIESPNAYVNYWIDEPVGAAGIGNVMASQFDRPDAVSVLAYTTFSGPPINVDPFGSQALMLYACEGAPAAELVHYPRWMIDRLS